MRRATTILLLLAVTPALFPHIARAQSQSPARPGAKADADRLGLTCVQILKMTSTEWIADFREKAQPPEPDPASSLSRASEVYGKCYDERTNRQAAALAKTGKGPLMGARGDFQDFEAALKGFAAKALAVYGASAPPAALSERTAYANLYEKQFRYLFYQEYEASPVKAAKPAPPATKPPAPGSKTSTAPAAAAKTAGPPVPATPEEQARSNADPVTMAKNRFGKLLEPLPDDQMHDLHRAFGDVIGPHHMSEATRLAVYRYAIFILEPPSATPFSPPPF